MARETQAKDAASMARTKEQARKASRPAPVAQDVESDEDMVEEEGCEDCTEDDGLDEWSVKDLLVATLREQRKLTQAVRDGNAGKHEIRRIDNRGNCGIGECKAKGSTMALQWRASRARCDCAGLLIA
jgi:hypothetical protein